MESYPLIDKELTMNYENETRSFLNRLTSAGFNLVEVFYDDFDDDRIEVSTIEEATEELVATDESFLIARSPEGKRVTLFFVYGNNPGELVADYSDHPLLTTIVDQHYAHFNQ